MQAALGALRKAMADPVTKPFSTRVLDRVAPEYSKVITQPMDLSKIRRELEDTSSYQTTGQVRADIALVGTLFLATKPWKAAVHAIRSFQPQRID